MSQPPDFLARMAASSAERVAAARAVLPLRELEARARARAAPPRLSLSADRFDLIMELKLSSPAMGVLASPTLDLETQVGHYADAGAAVVSVLTEPTRFSGDLDHLDRAAQALATRGVPAMRKDFLVDPYQVVEARHRGAGGVLLILRMLDDATLERMLEVAADHGLFVLLEAFDAADLARVARVAGHWPGARQDLLVGINSRDLATLAVVPDRLDELVGLLPDAHPKVAESGLLAPEDAARYARAGYTVALVGTALMSSSDPVALGRAMIEAGRAAWRERES